MQSEKSGILGILALVLGVFLFFVILNYFNIISLSRIYPNQLGFLPHKTYPFPTPAQLTSIPCPVDPQFCDKGIKIYDGDKFLGIGYKLPIGKKIFASIPGLAVFGGVEDKAKDVLSHAKIVIGGEGVSKTYVATYEYFGAPRIKDTQTKNVLSAEELGAVWGGSFPDKAPFNGINVLVLIQNNGKEILEFPK